jgi:P4 family phage/plasmid primase-like protien
MNQEKISPLDEVIMRYREGLIKINELLGRYTALKHNIKNFFLEEHGGMTRNLGLYKLNEEQLYWNPINEEHVKVIIQESFNELLKKGVIEYEKKDDNEVKPFLSIRMVNETFEFIKREYFQKLDEEVNNYISFKNAYAHIGNLLKGNIEGSIIDKKNIDKTNIPLCFYYIPHNLRINELKEYFSLGEIPIESEKELFEIEAPKTVEIFKQWVNEDWLLLFEIIGYCFVPYYPMNKAFMLIGTGANGKSTFTTLLAKILGEYNITSISLQELTEDKFAKASLFNKLANIHPDIRRKPLKYTDDFKQLTGEDIVSANRKFKDRIQFHNRAKLIFACNQLPETNETSKAFWDRWIIIQFPNTFERRISNIEFINNNFSEEDIEKIIALSLYAIYLVLKRGSFSIPKIDVKEIWLRKSVPEYAFMQDMIKKGIIQENKEASAEGNIIYELYNKYCEENGIEPKSVKQLYKSLEERFGYTHYRKEGYVYIKGITIRKENLSDYLG